jgi:hypothetical protein
VHIAQAWDALFSTVIGSYALNASLTKKELRNANGVTRCRSELETLNSVTIRDVNFVMVMPGGIAMIESKPKFGSVDILAGGGVSD